jgi:hypothetical protein
LPTEQSVVNWLCDGCMPLQPDTHSAIRQNERIFAGDIWGSEWFRRLKQPKLQISPGKTGGFNL